MPVPFLLGALAALGVGGALGAARGAGVQKQQEAETMRGLLVQAAMSGTDLPPDVLGQYFSKNAVPAFKLMAQAVQARNQQRDAALLGTDAGAVAPPAADPWRTQGMPPPAAPGGQPDALTNVEPGGAKAPLALFGFPTTVPPGQATNPNQLEKPADRADISGARSRFSPFVPSDVGQMVSPEGTPMPTPVPGADIAGRAAAAPAAAEPEATRLPGVTVEAPRPVRPRPTISGTTSTGLQVTRQGISPEQAAKMEQEKITEHRKTKLEERQQAAQGEVGTLLEQAAQAPDLAGKLPLFEQALAKATGAGLPVATTLSDQIKELRDKISGKALNLSDPNTAEYIATTGKNPHTNQPIDPAIRRQAQGFVKQQTDRKLAQAQAQAQVLANIQTKALPERAAITGSIKTLVKEGDNITKSKAATDQIQGALATIEKNLDVFPANILGKPMALTAEFLQTARGRRMLQVQQAIALLQSLEPRKLAGEQGRIANQIEQRWKEVLPDPTKVTRATAQALLESSRQRLNDLTKANMSTVQRNALAARRAGVPDPLVRAFTEGDLDVLKSTLGEGLESGAMPTTIDLEDLK